MDFTSDQKRLSGSDHSLRNFLDLFLIISSAILSFMMFNQISLSKIGHLLFQVSWFFGQWLYDYQALVAGLLALAAALITVFVMRQNHEDLLYRKNLAARAYMHDIASEICGYCQECFTFFVKEYEQEKHELFLEKPVNAVKKLCKIIGCIDKESAKAIAQLLSKYQVFHSRLKTRDENYKRKLVGHIAEVIEIYILSERVFPYARNGEDESLREVSIETGDVTSAYALRRLNSMWGNYFGFGIAYSPPEELNKEIIDQINSHFKN